MSRIVTNLIFCLIALSAMVTCRLGENQTTCPSDCGSGSGTGGGTLAYPLKASANGRYLTDSNGVPFLIMGDSMQCLMNCINEADAEAFFANREVHGINANWMHFYSDWTDNKNGNPFTSGDGVGSDISSPSEVYFEHVDRALNMAKRHGVVVFFGVGGTNGTGAGGGDTKFFANGADKANAFGRYLGNRYKNQGNIVWTLGNDLGLWNENQDVIKAFLDGIRTTDIGHHPMAFEFMDHLPELTSDVPLFYSSYASVNNAYSYGPYYEIAHNGYVVNHPLPVVGFETWYEGNDRGGPVNPTLRWNMWWGILWGMNGGYLYGSEATWGHGNVSPDVLNTTLVNQVSYAKKFLIAHRWYDLVPDYGHTLVTDGYGEFAVTGQGVDVSSNIATVSGITPDAKVAIAYMEHGRNTTVNMSKMSGSVTARWFNPRDGSSSLIGGGPFANNGSHVFTPPDNDNDWVLLLEAN